MPGTTQKMRLSDRVADELVSYIVDNKLHEGDKLPNESQLMEITGAGRSSVREAMKLLASRNIVVIKQGSGTYVAKPPSVADDPLGFAFVDDKLQLALDMLEIRQILEPEIASMAAMRASDADIERIRKLNHHFGALQRDGINADDTDVAFHKAVAAASSNLVVPRLVPLITSAIRLSIELTQHARVSQSADEHRIIADAIAEHDPITARDTMYTHIYASRQQLKRMRDQLRDADEASAATTSPLTRSLETGMQKVLYELFGTRSGPRGW